MLAWLAPLGLVGWLARLDVATVATGVAMGALLAAAWHDLRLRIIPNTICLLLALFGMGLRLRVGLIDFAFSAFVALLLFFLLFAAFSRGVVGGGDVKLMVATGLWFSPPDCYVFVVVTALAGGVLAVLHMLLGMALRASAARGADRAGLRQLARWSAAAGRAPPDADAPSGVAAIMKGSAIAGCWRAELERIRSGSPLPYGVAIAIGGCYTLLVSLGG